MTCPHCGEPIHVGDDAIEMGGGGRLHRECLIRMLVGSVGHQLHLCSCYGGDYEDPETLTKRDAARAAADLACSLRKVNSSRRRDSPGALRRTTCPRSCTW